MWTHPSRQKLSKKNSTLHNLLGLQPFLVLTLSPFPLTCEPNTYRFMCSCKMAFQQKLSAKMLKTRQTHKKGEQRGGDLPPDDKNCAQQTITHIPFCPSLTPSSWSTRLSPHQPGSHTPCCQKHNTSPPQQERQTRDKNDEEEVFFPPKKSQTTELFGSICYKTKIRHNNMISEINVNLT
jgi:hypothetical protein